MNNHFSRVIVFYWHLGSTFPICSSILCMLIFIIFFKGFQAWGSHYHFIQSSVQDKGNPLGGMLFTLVHLCALHLIAVAHPACVFLSLVDDIHIVGLASNVLTFFVITWGIWHIRIFSATHEVCCLISTGVKPIYNTSSNFFYSWVQSLYSRCPNWFFAIYGILCIIGKQEDLRTIISFHMFAFLKQLLRCFHFVMPNNQTIYNV